MSFAEVLRKERMNRGWSQEELAQRLGVHLATLAKWEQGRYSQASYGILANLIQTFGKTLEELEVPSEMWRSERGIEIRQQEAVGQVAIADSSNIQEVAASQLAIINSYYQSGLEQSQQSFRWSLIWGGVGFAFLLLAVGVLLLRQPSEVAYASGLGGVIVEVFAGIYLYLYKHASDQLAAFRTSLEDTQRLLLANSMCEKLTGEREQQTRAEIIRLIVGAAVTSQKMTATKEKM